jgi:hypothetical protein
VGRGGGLSGGEQKDERRREQMKRRSKQPNEEKKGHGTGQAPEEGYYGHYKKVNVFRGWEKWLIPP